MKWQRFGMLKQIPITDSIQENEGDEFWESIRHQLAWEPNGGAIIGRVLDSIPYTYFRKFLGKRTYDSLLKDYNTSIQH